jgi:hypothetical protein
MNTLQIRKVLTKHVKYFQGVYPIDLLPPTLIKSSIIVINLDKHYMPGSHCVAVCFSDSGYAEYFDSYGLPPFKYETTAYPQRHSISWTFNGHRLHGLTSNVCRHYCCLYTFHKALGQSMTSFVDMFLPARYTCNDKRGCACFAVILRSVLPVTRYSSNSSSRARPRYK